MTQNELMHYGKIGMKWGKRTYSQDELKTGSKIIKESQGVVRGTKEVNSAVMKVRTKKRESEKTKKPKTLSRMSDKDLQAKIQRLNMEQQYSNLTRQPQQRMRGQEALETTLAVGGGVLTAVGSAVSIALAVKQLTGN